MKHDVNSLTEVLEPTDEHRTPSSSPKRADSQDAGPLHMIELSHMIQRSTTQVAHEQHDDTAANIPERYLVRADTEQRLGDHHTPAEEPTPGSLRTLTSQSSTGREQNSSLTTEVSPRWRAHHQDFYSSKWFRSIQIFIIVSVILVAVLIFTCAVPSSYFDLFASYDLIISLPTFSIPVFIFLCTVVGGIFTSKVFRETLEIKMLGPRP